MFRFIKFFILVFIFLSNVFSQNIVWYNYGPYGAFAYDIKKLDNGNIFVATEAGIYKKQAKNDRWNFIGGKNGAHSICIDNKGRIIIGTFFRGIYYSDNYGESWTYPASNLNSPIFVNDIFYLNFDNKYLAVTNKGLFYTDNIDSTFIQLMDSSLINKNCISIYQDSAGFIYVGTDSGIFKSNSIKEPFKYFGLNDYNINNITESPDHVLWACANYDGLYSYNTSEKEWVYKGLGKYSSAYPNYLYFFNSDTLFSGGLYFYKSFDGGNSWLKEEFNHSVESIEKIDSQNLFISNSKWGVFRYNINSAAFKEDNLGLTNKFLYSIDINSKDQIVLTGRCGVYFSNDHGNTYELIYEVKGGYYTNSNAVITDNSEIIYSTSYGRIYKYSQNYWREIFNTGIGSWPIVFKGKDNNLYITTKYDEIYFSSDLGEHWILQKDFDDLYIGKLAPYENYIILGTNKGLLKSADNGKSWNTFAFEDTATYSFYLNLKGEIFVPYRYMLFYSDNKGQTWKKIFSKISCGAVGSICTNSNEDIFITTNDGVYISKNKGKTWKLENEGLETYWGLSLDRDSEDYIYLITNYHGIFRTMESTTGIFYNKSTIIRYTLHQNYPNPFNLTTTIKYALPKAANVKLEVFNVLGQKVATLVEGRQAAGYHQAIFNARNLPSGVYYYRLTTDKGFGQTRKLVLLK